MKENFVEQIGIQNQNRGRELCDPNNINTL